MPLGTQPGALITGRSTRQIDQALHELVRTLVIAVPLALAVAAGGGIFLARRALKPVDKIAQTAQEIEENDLSERINVNTKDELGRLAATLNAMIGRLERAFQRQKQFTSDASHELRAPLAVIEAESSLALQKERPPSDYRQSLETISQESRQMSLLIEHLLTLARADAGKEQWNFGEVNLGRLITNLSADVEVLCQEKGLICQLGQTQDLVIKGDEARLRELFMNLMDNAIRYTPAPGTVSISLRQEGQTAVVAIRDTGVGIPGEDIPFIFERFYRVDKSRSRAEGGTGLGLAICRYIAEAHGGKIEVESQVGSGSTFSVWLPSLSP
jgi:heavy metal sensor kinase